MSGKFSLLTNNGNRSFTSVEKQRRVVQCHLGGYQAQNQGHSGKPSWTKWNIPIYNFLNSFLCQNRINCKTLAAVLTITRRKCRFSAQSWPPLNIKQLKLTMTRSRKSLKTSPILNVISESFRIWTLTKSHFWNSRWDTWTKKNWK